MRLQGEEGETWGSADARVLHKRQEVQGSKACRFQLPQSRPHPPLLDSPTVNNFTTEMERRCCQAGLRESPVGLSSKKRARHVRHGPACVAAFRQCCQLSETLTREALEEQLLLGTTDEDKDLDDLFEDNTPVSTLFPESWLWKMFTSPKSESGREN
ncbi:complement C3-like, transcript variant X3 [Ictidomys tridecemlineatus]|nr:complement C3-like, transcript variant X3 [Ictidomys tridecemlineatus]